MLMLFKRRRVSVFIATMFHVCFAYASGLNGQTLRIEDTASRSSVIVNAQLGRQNTAQDIQNVVNSKFEISSFKSMNYSRTSLTITYSAFRRNGKCAPVFRNERKTNEDSIMFSNIYLFQQPNNKNNKSELIPILALTIESDGQANLEYSESIAASQAILNVVATNECQDETIGVLKVKFESEVEVEMNLVAYGEALAFSGYSENNADTKSLNLGEAMAGVFSFTYSTELSGFNTDQENQ